nr:MAG TPA_asm: hypothetical protein [Caudoviricetes sp.]
MYSAAWTWRCRRRWPRCWSTARRWTTRPWQRSRQRRTQRRRRHSACEHDRMRDPGTAAHGCAGAF